MTLEAHECTEYATSRSHLYYQKAVHMQNNRQTHPSTSQRSRSSDKSFLYLRIKKINNSQKVRVALRHNKRDIQRELGADSTIDSTKMHGNYSLTTEGNASDMYKPVQAAINQYHRSHTKRIRKDAIHAIEIIFTIPSSHNVDCRLFFQSCLDWVMREFKELGLISSDVHRDEANPHMHVLLNCITADKLIGARSVGFGKEFKQRNQRFLDEVGKKFGLEAAPAKLVHGDRKRLAHSVIQKMKQDNDPLLKSSCLSLVRNAIDDNPVPYAQLLGIPIVCTPKPLRTVAQIMTSKGKGPNWEKPEQTLSCVDFTPV